MNEDYCNKCGEPLTTFYSYEDGEKYHNLEHYNKDCFGHRFDNLEFVNGVWTAPGMPSWRNNNG
jgi:hypothetical protein